MDGMGVESRQSFPDCSHRIRPSHRSRVAAFPGVLADPRCVLPPSFLHPCLSPRMPSEDFEGLQIRYHPSPAGYLPPCTISPSQTHFRLLEVQAWGFSEVLVSRVKADFENSTCARAPSPRCPSSRSTAPGATARQHNRSFLLTSSRHPQLARPRLQVSGRGASATNAPSGRQRGGKLQGRYRTISDGEQGSGQSTPPKPSIPNHSPMNPILVSERFRGNVNTTVHLSSTGAP